MEKWQKANYVLWCPEDFPENVRIEWKFQPSKGRQRFPCHPVEYCLLIIRFQNLLNENCCNIVP
ncbi:MAG: YesU family protein [Acetatifactor sp.]|nr:YesU family protein [Acetatifactor sp.]